MAAPSYATNLSDITLAQATTGFTAVGGGGSLVSETDFYIQNGNCVSKNTSATWDSSSTPRGGALYNNGTGITVPTDGAVLMWMYWWGPGVLDVKANGGVEVNIGASTTNYDAWYVSGSDDWEFGGWRCYPVSPTVATSRVNGSGSGGTYQYFGWQAYVANANSIGKGAPWGCDAIRYGRCDLVCTLGDLANGYATFIGAAAWDNTSTRRLGLFYPQNGAYYQQGLFQMGTSGSAVDFRDANRAIFIQNTEKVTANFNTFEVLNASSYVSWTNIGVSALGTVSKGRFVVTDNATVLLTNCTFTDMNTFSFQSNTTVSGTTFRRCGQITTGGAIIDGCRIDNSTATIAVTTSSPANAALVSNTVFVSDGTGHGLEITGTAANISLTGLSWSGYASADGSTGNEAVYVNIASGSMSITISGGTTPSIRTAGCVVTVVSGAVSATVKAVTTTGTAISGVRVFLEADTGGPLPSGASVTIANSGTTATVTHTAHGMITNDKVVIRGASLQANNGVFTITKIDNNSYSYTMSSTPGSSPTGTITASFVAISDVTVGSGEVTMSRVFAGNQAVKGWARKSTSSPYYKTSQITGTINSSTGYSATVPMISDE